MATVADLRPCQVALLRVPLGNHGASVVVEKRLAASVRRIDARYKKHPQAKHYPIRKEVTGAYNCRKTTSGSSWSKHSYGAAVDINWDRNPYGRNLVTDMPVWFRQLWKDEGWGWGGDWRSVKDAMHFSKFPNEGGDGKLDAVYMPGTEEDDGMAEITQKRFNELLDGYIKKHGFSDTPNNYEGRDGDATLARVFMDIWAAAYTAMKNPKAGGKPILLQHLEVVDNKLDAIAAELKIKFTPDGKRA